MTRAAALLLALCLAPAAAQEGAAVKALPPEGKVALAKPFTFTVEADLPAGWQVALDTASSNSEFEFVSADLKSSGTGAARRTETYAVTAKAFALGVSTVPAVAWRVSGPGSEGQPLALTEPFPVEVEAPFKIKEDEDIKDIYPPYSYTPWLLLLLLALALAAAVYQFYKRYAAKPGSAFSPAAWSDARTPYQRARERLERLLATPLAREGKFKQYYTGLTSVLRLYLQEEFGLDAAQMTTADLGRELKRTGADIKTALKARELLQRADLVKFARHRPADPEADGAAAGDLMIEFNRLAEEARAKAARAAAEAAEAARLAAKRGGK